MIILKNPKDRIIAALITLLLIFALFSLAVIASESLSVSAKSATLYETGKGKFYYTKAADTRLPMASTTKIMTALVALDKASPDTVISVPSEAVGIEGSSLYLKAGERFTLRDLLYGLMLRSANDAAVAIACSVGGSLPRFVDMMNEKALELGLVNTHFENPHGLDGDSHYTTARELALITAEAMKNPLFCKITSTYKVTITNSEGDARLVVNHNKLLKQYSGCFGIKTGFTQRCGRCLVSAAERDGITLVAVTINAPDDWRDHRNMLDFGFSTLENVRLAGKMEISHSIPTLGGIPSTVRVSNRDELYAVLPKSRGEISVKVVCDDYLYTPYDINRPIGYAAFYLDNEKLGQVDLFPITN